MPLYKSSAVIFGGGVAGLWTLNKLTRLGIPSVLFESNQLGGVQTLSAQGILHSGMKYTLDGMTSGQPSILAEMLPIWSDCLLGKGEIDLRGVVVHSPCTYFWSSSLSLGGLVAPLVLKSRVAAIKDKGEWPLIFQDKDFSGRVHRIEEQVINVKSLVSRLGENGDGRIFHGRFTRAAVQEGDDTLRSVLVTLCSGQTVEVQADAFIFCGGEGNHLAAKELGLGDTGQLRPLAMIVLEDPPGDLFGHCIVTSKRPRATITTHQFGSKKFWYIGGNMAEEGVRMSDKESISWARTELRSIFPWLEWNHRPMKVHRVNRAEPKQSALVLPEGPRLLTRKNVAIAWPTKMVLAPALAREVEAWLRTLDCRVAPQESLSFPPPPLGALPWE